MMPQIGFSEMLLLGILALVVLGPRDLPLMMRKFGRFTGKLRAMAWEFRQSFDEIGRQAELDELRKEVEALKKSTVDPIKQDLEQTQAEMRAESAAVTKAIADTSKPIEHPETDTVGAETAASEDEMKPLDKPDAADQSEPSSEDDVDTAEKKPGTVTANSQKDAAE